MLFTDILSNIKNLQQREVFYSNGTRGGYPGVFWDLGRGLVFLPAGYFFRLLRLIAHLVEWNQDKRTAKKNRKEKISQKALSGIRFLLKSHVTFYFVNKKPVWSYVQFPIAELYSAISGWSRYFSGTGFPSISMESIGSR